MSTHILSVPDISCDHCKAAIERAVGALDGVTSAHVDVAAKSVTVDGDATLPDITAAIADAGYEVTGPA